MARKTKRGIGENGKTRKRDAKSKPAQIRDRPTVSIIGAGRLGTALAIALSDKNYEIESVVARRIQSARRAARVIGPKTGALSFDQLSSLPPSEILFITTPDDAIESVAAQLAGSIEWSGRRRIAMHASGALSSDALSSLRAVGFSTGSMHPLVSVSEPLAGSARFELAHFCIEGQPQAVRVARSMVRTLGGKSFSISTRDKALYHAAAVMSSGHITALFDIATEMLMRCGLTERQASDVLLPLLKSTVENLAFHPPSRALTGTFARADAATVLKHLIALRKSNSRDALEAYTLLGRRSINLAKKSGASIESLKAIEQALEKALQNKLSFDD